ncbi:cardiolipin synthase [Namhaeicola litoreus]|uniref:Cardiolipin synthase n=1 Tax=Namhaeicola litoreus TaxID=1052145 RepID=A0ABW3Y3B7_9FLAO
MNSVFIIFYYLAVSVLVVVIILEHRNPGKAFAYIFLLLLFPVIGLILYFIFGFHYQKKVLYKRLRNYHNDFLKTIDAKRKFPKKEFEGTLEKLSELFYNIDRVQFSEKNEVQILFNGEKKFPVVLEEIEKAKEFIYLDYYIINDDNIGNDIFDLLLKKSKEGLKVKVLYDDVGSSIKRKRKTELRSAGIEIHAYMPVLFSQFAHKANYRNHRKIIIIDGFTGFLGGINISDVYINSDANKLFWRDTHVMIKGEATIELQFLFINDWFYATGKKVSPVLDINFSAIKQKTYACVLGSEYGSNFETIMEAFVGLISLAKKEIVINTPYFVPPVTILQLLKIKAKCGIKIKLLVPRKPDIKTAFYASYSYILELIESGVEVYAYTKGMMHAKTMVIDKKICTIGTSNFDHRSFSLNSEVNAFFIDEDLCIELLQQFEEDVKNAYLIDLKSLKNRPWYKKGISAAARLLAPIL